LAANSEKAYQHTLVRIEEKITEAAKLGERTISYIDDRCSWSVNDYEQQRKNKPFVQVIIQRLVNRGFNARLDQYGPYSVFGDPDGDQHYDMRLYITW
jgi:hypothetical protein